MRSADDAHRLLRSGADKVGVNTAAVESPELIAPLARRFGSQCVVLSVDARRRRRRLGGGHPGRPPADRARRAGLDPRGRRARRGGDPAHQHRPRRHAGGLRPRPARRGRGGRGRAGDRLGGRRRAEHLADALAAGAAAVLAASIFHQGTYTVGEVKRELAEAGFPIRRGEPDDRSRELAATTSAASCPSWSRTSATGAVLMLAWADREAVELTLSTGQAHFWSRSRQALWQQGGDLGQHPAGRRGHRRLRRRRPARARPSRPGRPATAAPGAASSPTPPGWSSAGSQRSSTRAGAPIRRRATRRGCSPRASSAIAQKVGEEGVETAIAAVLPKAGGARAVAWWARPRISSITCWSCSQASGVEPGGSRRRASPAARFGRAAAL